MNNYIHHKVWNEITYPFLNGSRWNLAGISNFIPEFSAIRPLICVRIDIGGIGAELPILEWHHNECDDVSNHRRLEYLLSRLFRRTTKKNIKAPRHWSLCVCVYACVWWWWWWWWCVCVWWVGGWGDRGGGIPSQMASNAENVSTWRHHKFFQRRMCTIGGYCGSVKVMHGNICKYVR